MLNFYAIAKQLPTRIVIKRAGVGFYFRFLFAMIEFNDLKKELDALNKLYKGKELYLKLLEFKNKTDYIEKQFIMAVESLINCKWKNVKESDKQCVIESILSFNSYFKTKNNREIKKEELEKELEFILYFFLERGYKISDTSENISYYQACAMIEQWKQDRIIKMSDTRVAYHADKKEWKDAIYELKGYTKITSIEQLKELADG